MPTITALDVLEAVLVWATPLSPSLDVLADNLVWVSPLWPSLDVLGPNSSLGDANDAHIERTHGHSGLGKPIVAFIGRTRPQF
jgi:hypothetical protein